MRARAHILSLSSPLDCSPPSSSVHGVSQARILEWIAIPSPGDLPDPGIEPASPALQVDSLALSHQVSPPSSTGTHSHILIGWRSTKITEIGKEKTNFRNRNVAVYIRKNPSFVGLLPPFVFVNKLGDRILGQETGSPSSRAASHSCLGTKR